MDQRLRERLIKIEKQITLLKNIEAQLFHLEAHKKVLFSKLYLLTPDGNVASKEAHVYSSEDWMSFSYGLAAHQAEHLEQERMLRLKEKAFDAAYTTFKLESSAIKRQL